MLSSPVYVCMHIMYNYIWLCIHRGQIRTPPCAAADFGQRTHWMCVIQYVSLYDCHSTTLPGVILTSWARPLSLLLWQYACFIFLHKKEGSKLDDNEDTHACARDSICLWLGRTSSYFSQWIGNRHLSLHGVSGEFASGGPCSCQ